RRMETDRRANGTAAPPGHARSRTSPAADLMIISLLLFLLGIAIILGGAAVFTNGVEWLGRRMGISDGAIGSILAGIATALPETLIPVIAIFGGHSETETEIGIGAILGPPLMLGTLVLPLLAEIGRAHV